MQEGAAESFEPLNSSTHQSINQQSSLKPSSNPHHLSSDHYKQGTSEQPKLYIEEDSNIKSFEIVEEGNILQFFVSDKSQIKDFSVSSYPEFSQNQNLRKIFFFQNNFKLEKFEKEDNNNHEIMCGNNYGHIWFWNSNNNESQSKIPILFKIFQYNKNQILGQQNLIQEIQIQEGENNESQQDPLVIHNYHRGSKLRINLFQIEKDEMKLNNKYEIFNNYNLKVLKVIPQLNEDLVVEMLQDIFLMELTQKEHHLIFSKENEEQEIWIKNKLIVLIEEELQQENLERKKQRINDIAKFKELVLKKGNINDILILNLPAIKIEILDIREKKPIHIYFIGQKQKFKIGMNKEDHFQMNKEFSDKYNLEIEFTSLEQDEGKKWYISNNNIFKSGYSIEYSIWKLFDCPEKEKLDQLYYEFKHPTTLFRIEETQFVFVVTEAHKFQKKGSILNQYYHQEENVDMEDEYHND